MDQQQFNLHYQSYNIADTQTSIGRHLGTTTDGTSGKDIAKTLNYYYKRSGVLSKDWYTRELISKSAYKYQSQIDSFHSKIVFDLQWDQPIIITVNGNWPNYGYTACHFITIYGQTYSADRVQRYYFTDSIANSGIANSNKAGMAPYRVFLQSDIMYAVSDGSIIW